MKYFFLSFVVLISLATRASADPRCAKLFSSLLIGQTTLEREIHEFRKQRILPAKISSISVNGNIYDVLGVLGVSSSTTYLARSGNGSLVQIKDIARGPWANSVFYELAATEFYIESGVKVSRILDHQIEYAGLNQNGEILRALIVKEYFEGITGVEFVRDKPFSSAQNKQLSNSIFDKKDEILHLFHKFRSWLALNKLDLQAHPFPELNKLLEEGDFGYKNFLYSAKFDEWILFDP